MKKLVLTAIVLAAGVGLFQHWVSASGSIGPGSGKVSPRAAYSKGKALTFDLLVCDSCPIKKGELDRDRARSLTASLVAVYNGKKTGSRTTKRSPRCAVKGDVQGEECKTRMEVVHYFLTRRFKL